MDTVFLNQTIHFLEKSELHFSFPEIRLVEFEQGSTVTTIRLGNHVYSTTRELTENFTISNLVLFSLFNSYLENKNKALIGLTFKGKYEQLIQSTDLDIIEKELYRLLQLIRDCLVMNAQGIRVTDNYYEFSYKHPKTNAPYHLYLQKNILSVLYTMVMLVIRDDLSFHNESIKTGLLRSYYDELRREISRIGNLFDDLSSVQPNLIGISSGIRLSPSVRFRVENPKFTFDKNIFTFERYTSALPDYSCDYLLLYDGEKHLIPEEALTRKRKIYLDEIQHWRLPE